MRFLDTEIFSYLSVLNCSILICSALICYYLGVNRSFDFKSIGKVDSTLDTALTFDKHTIEKKNQDIITN